MSGTLANLAGLLGQFPTGGLPNGITPTQMQDFIATMSALVNGRYSSTQSTSAYFRRLTSTATFSGTTPFSALTAGINTANFPGSTNTGYPVFTSTFSSPVVNVLYCATAWSQMAINGGPWQQTGNGTTVDNAIKAASTNAFPTGTARFSYSTTTAGGSGWVLPSGVNVVPNPAGGLALKVFCPSGVFPCPDSDGHMAVYQPNGTVLETYATYVLGDGTLVSGNMNVTNPASLLDGYQGGMLASMLPNWTGLITQSDITSGAINHAMPIAIPGSQLITSIAYPAVTFDRNNTYSGAIPMGTRLALPQSLNVASARSWACIEGLALAYAAQNYGFIVSDTGGGGVTIRAEYHITDTEYNGAADFNLANDITYIMQHVQIVTSVPT